MMQVVTPRFKDALTLDERKRHSLNMADKNPDKIPIICEKHVRSKLNILDKNK